MRSFDGGNSREFNHIISKIANIENLDFLKRKISFGSVTIEQERKFKFHKILSKFIK